MATWNYRVMEFTEDGETIRGIHEVYYHEDGKPFLYTEEASDVWWAADSKESTPHDILRRMEEALTKPILRKEDFPI